MGFTSPAITMANPMVHQGASGKKRSGAEDQLGADGEQRQRECEIDILVSDWSLLAAG